MTIRFDEKDIEDWLYKYPEKVKIGFSNIYEWVARQYHVPSGIIDLLGYIGSFGIPKADPCFCVVEVKNVPIRSDALTQVCRYSKDIKEILLRCYTKQFDIKTITPETFDPEWKPTIRKCIITTAKSLNKTILFEAEALGVDIISIELEESFSISGIWHFSKYFREKNINQYENLTKEFDKYFQKDVFEEFMNKLEKKDSKED